MSILETIYGAVMLVFLCGLWLAAGIVAIQLSKLYAEDAERRRAQEKARQEKAQKKPYVWSNSKLNLSSSVEDDEDDFGYDM